MHFNELNDNNIMIYAMKAYDNPACTSLEEFQEDFNRIKYIKRLLTKYHKTGELKERLILNHIIIFYNVFELEAATRMLFSRINRKYYPYLKPFLVYLNFMHDSVNGESTREIIMSQEIIERLRKL